MSWFLESWAVPEGCAFATHRDYESGTGARVYVDPPDQVIYVCPPHYLPTPAGYATALGAARGRFQEKFVDDQGVEVAFESLDPLIELVRRSYLAAGAGSLPLPDGVPPPQQPDPETPELLPDEKKDWAEAIRRLRTAQSPSEKRDTAQFLVSIWTPSASTTVRAFCARVLDTLCDEAKTRVERAQRAAPMNQRVQLEAAFLERDMRDFALLSVEMDECLEWADGAAFVARVLERFSTAVGGLNGRQASIGRPPVCWPAATTDGLSRAIASGLLHRLPCPVTWQPYSQLVRLGDHLAASMSDRGYLRTAASFSHILPLLVSGLALAAAESYRFRTGGPFRDASVVRCRAFDWIAREVPDNRLDSIPLAGRAVTQVLEAATTSRSTL